MAASGVSSGGASGRAAAGSRSSSGGEAVSGDAVAGDAVVVEESDARVCAVGGGGEATAFNAAQQFVGNDITTTRYTLYSFLPRSLLEQFRRLANLYFLSISVLMVIGTYYHNVFDSPLSPYSTLGPLALVLGITMVKEGLEDMKRRKSDRQVNSRTAQVLMPGGHVDSCRWDELTVGSIVRVTNRQEVPADMVVLWSSDNKASGGICYIETSNIDGETNLKIREALPQVQSKCAKAAKLGAVRGKLEYEQPNDHVHTFSGRLSFSVGINGEQEVASVDARHVLLRGCTLRNTKSVYGLVVYTGKDTKVMKKASGARSKMSLIEYTANRCIIIVFLAQIALCVASTYLLAYWERQNSTTVPYLQLSTSSYVVPTWVAYFLTYMVLYNNFIPISLYVTIEMAFYTLAYFIDKDREMYDPVSDTPAQARTSSLVTDLGQIEYLLTDKTGTLTQNVMRFKMASVAGRVLGNTDDLTRSSVSKFSEKGGSWNPGAPDPLIFELLSGRQGEESAARAQAFFLCTSICHTVVVEENEETGELEFQAESPDESALLSAAQDVGYTFVGREPSKVHVNVPEDSGLPADDEGNCSWQLLGVHEFNAARKRMSVVVRAPDGKAYLYCKGADNVMFDRAAADQADTVEAVGDHLDIFARAGLRTLVLGQRELPPDVLAAWHSAYRTANAAIDSRDEKLAKVAKMVERELEILGATAIEDKLQDGVPGTIKDLADAGIKTWVLTGDKVETAINIGYSCNLLADDMHLIRVEGRSKSSVQQQLDSLARIFGELQRDPRAFFQRLQTVLTTVPQQLRKLGGPGIIQPPGSAGADDSHSFAVKREAVGAVSVSSSVVGRQDGRGRGNATVETDSLALIVTGPSLEFVIGNEQAEEHFMMVARLCKCVVACRVSPQQKAELVRLVREKGALNGRRKKPMTLAIGDGANDVGMIQRAEVGVGISGREGLQAVNASDFSIAQFRFLRRLLLVHGRWNYRRLAKVLLYSFYKNIVLVLLLFYYSFFTGFSGASIFESLIYAGYNFFLGWPPLITGIMDQDLPAKVVLANPQVYISGRMNLNLGVRKMFQWILHAVVHSFIVFALPHYIASESQVWSEDGSADGLYVYGTVIYSGLIFAMDLRAAMVKDSWNVFNYLSIWVGSVLFYLVFLLVYSKMLDYSPQFFGEAYQMLPSPRFWFVIALVLGVFYVVDVSVEWFRRQNIPTVIDIVSEIHRLGLSFEQKPGSALDDTLDEPLLQERERDRRNSVDSYVETTRRGTLRVTREAFDALASDLDGETRAELGWDHRDAEPAGEGEAESSPARYGSMDRRKKRDRTARRSAFDFNYSSRQFGPGAGQRQAPVELDNESVSGDSVARLATLLGDEDDEEVETKAV